MTLSKLAHRIARRITTFPPGWRKADVYQEVTLGLLELANKYIARGDHDDTFPFIAWIYVRAYGDIRTKLKKEWQKDVVAGYAPEWFVQIPGKEPEDDFGDREMLEYALQTLTDRQRDVLKAMYFEGKSQDQIAAERGISQPAVCRIANRAMVRLRKLLMGDE